jgi:polar amino acid transport system substrate-binding protein
MAQEVRLAYEQFPPFEYLEDGQARGTNMDQIRNVCAELGLTPVFLQRPWARALEDVRDGLVDGVFSLFRTSAREEFLFYADVPLAHEEVVVFVTREDLHLASIGDLRGLNVGVIRGYSYGEGIRASLPENTAQFKDGTALLRMLCQGRIDAALTTRFAGEGLLAQLSCDQTARVALTLSRRPLFIAFSRKIGDRGQRLAEAFTRELGSRRRGGQFGR